jgi:hypothetical protein
MQDSTQGDGKTASAQQLLSMRAPPSPLSSPSVVEGSAVLQARPGMFFEDAVWALRPVGQAANVSPSRYPDFPLRRTTQRKPHTVHQSHQKPPCLAFSISMLT